MILQRLRLRNFRNFEDETVDFPERGAALIGDNGQGKTNLLEAVYYLEIFRSFRGARDEQLITFGCGHFRVEAQISAGADGEEVEVAAGYAREGRRKKVTVEGHEPERVAEAIGRVGAIVFTASDVEIVAGGPGARRRFLDIILSLVEPGYITALQRYRQVLAQRNGLLRDDAGPSELVAWNAGLVKEGSRIAEARARWVSARAPSFTRYYGAISGGQEAGIEYSPSIPAPAGAEPALAREGWAEAFHLEIERLAARERRRGVTLVGPHRDDLRFWVSGGPDAVGLRGFGSAGQQRSAAVALRLVEAETLRAAHGGRPIVMLDDVFAELDPLRAERVAELFTAEDWGQVIVTSPKPSEFAFMGDSLTEYRVLDGTVVPV
ncbi:MAG: DNA replication and repair protein RecF [Gemmatimonadetes bacterium]|nr:DNA replication and repair protein RecF [Gemmatimonadota bacterium]